MTGLKKGIFLILLAFHTVAFAQDGFIKGSPALAYWETGNGSETVIVLHGGPAAAHDYLRPEWDELAKNSKVIYYDQRGCGKSDSADCYSWREHVSDLKRLITQISKGQKVILAGSSWGSMLALLYTYTYPQDVKGVILSGIVQWWGYGYQKQDCSTYAPTSSSYVKGRMYNQPIDFANSPKRFELRLFESKYTHNSMKDAPSLKQLKQIKTRVLAFGGSNCGRDASKQFLGVLPNLEIFTITESCHDPWYSHPKVFFEKCQEFITAFSK
jgi:pimeloyl-ACP methyl ester carboxylesterase